MSPRILAVFDFDHTVTSWDTTGRFIGWLLRRSPWRLSVVALTAPLFAPLFLIRRTRKVPIHFSIWVATFGFSHEQLHALGRAHIAHIAGAGRMFVLQDARSRIAQHQAQGHEVVVATGSLEFLAREILASEGVRDVTIVGSSVRLYFGGMFVHQHCFAERKLHMLAARGFHPPWAFVYSDHEADLPLFHAGRERFVVNPQPTSAARIAASLGSAATILSWQ